MFVLLNLVGYYTLNAKINLVRLRITMIKKMRLCNLSFSIDYGSQDIYYDVYNGELNSLVNTFDKFYNFYLLVESNCK